jgi:tetratricopeptide (TPR) repeat protein
LPIRQKNLGRDHLQVADVLFKLGIAHKNRDEFELSSDCLNECLRIRTNMIGQEHTLVADTLYELAGTLRGSLQVSGKLDPTQCYVDAIRIYRQSLGESHVKVAKCLARLGDILEAKKDNKKAGNCYEKAVAIFEVKLKRNPTPEMIQDYNVVRDYEAYAEVLLDWASFLDKTGNDGSAMKTYRRALVLLQVLRSQDDEVINHTLCRIANVLGREGRSREAVQLLEQVKERRIAAVGENHPLVADIYFSLGRLCEKKREYQEAIDALETCLRIRRATLGPFSEEVGGVITEIGVVQAHNAEFAKAIRTWDEALAIYKKTGLSDEDLAIADVREHQQNAKHMLEAMDG